MPENKLGHGECAGLGLVENLSKEGLEVSLTIAGQAVCLHQMSRVDVTSFQTKTRLNDQMILPNKGMVSMARKCCSWYF